MKKRKIRLQVLCIPTAILVAVIMFSMFFGNSFTEGLSMINSSILSNMGWLYSLTTLVLVIVCFAAMLSPFGKVRIGGRKASPTMKDRDLFAIVLCSIVGIGMVTWGTAEVMAHYTSPLSTLGVEPYSTEAANFAIETVMLHWTFPAYATYALPSLLYAFLFYNMKRPFSVSEILSPILGAKRNNRTSSIIDCICVFTLLCGLISTIGSTVLSLLGGFSELSGGMIQKSLLSVTVLAAIIVVVFVISSITGVMKGIRFLSNLNLRFFVVLALFVLITGPTAFIFNYGIEGFGNMVQNFFSSMLRTNAVSNDDWSYWWSIFYWAVYMAWAPISAMFIGKVCYGLTVRKIVMLTMIGPSLFTAAWMAIFGGTSMKFELLGYGIADSYKKGYEYTAYTVFHHLPLSIILIVVFLFVAAISVITACESATDALASLIISDIVSGETDEGIDGNTEEKEADIHVESFMEESDPSEGSDSKARNLIKIGFGLILGITSVIIVSYSDISGIKMISNIGGLPALAIEILVIVGICKIMMVPQKFDVNKDDYAESGQYKS